MKKMILAIGLIAFGSVSYFVNAQAGGDHSGLNYYTSLKEHCSYQIDDEKLENCVGQYGILEKNILPKLDNVKKRIYAKIKDADKRYGYLAKLNFKLEKIKADSRENEVKVFLIELVHQEIRSRMIDITNICTTEGEVFGARGLESEKCCRGLKTLDYIGGSTICYDESKGEPVCRFVDNQGEKYLMYPDESTLKPYSQIYNYQCRSD